MGGATKFANQALHIRMSRFGCTNRPFYHIVVDKAYRPRDTKPLEQIGTFDPIINEYDEKLVSINFERLHHWLKEGAQPSKPVAELLGLCGFYPIHPMTYIDAKRAREKAVWKERKYGKKDATEEPDNTEQSEHSADEAQETAV